MIGCRCHLSIPLSPLLHVLPTIFYAVHSLVLDKEGYRTGKGYGWMDGYLSVSKDVNFFRLELIEELGKAMRE